MGPRMNPLVYLSKAALPELFLHLQGDVWDLPLVVQGEELLDELAVGTSPFPSPVAEE